MWTLYNFHAGLPRTQDELERNYPVGSHVFWNENGKQEVHFNGCFEDMYKEGWAIQTSIRQNDGRGRQFAFVSKSGFSQR